jgi:hypothetical protein
MLRFGGMVLLGCLIQVSVSAQEIRITSGFVKDSVAIGVPINYYLTARYPESIMALFPDSTFKFSPFEYGDKQFFPTKTTNGISYDSAVYTLSTFEIDKTQYLSLPVYVTTARDCTAFESERDSVFLIEQIKIPASDTVSLKKLSLKSDTLYERVLTQFNTFFLFIVIGIIVITAISTWVLFGEKIIRNIKVKGLQKKYNQFVKDFNTQVDKLNKSFTPELAEQTATVWKRYMEGLTEIPYTKYTTQELKGKFVKREIGDTLSAIDRMVYGRIKPESLDSFDHLKSEAEDFFKKKIAVPEKNSAIQYTAKDIEGYVKLIQELPCPVCGSTLQKLNATTAYTVKSFILFTFLQKKTIVACHACLNKKSNKAIITTALLGWWGFPWGLIKTPQYIYLNIKAKKKNNNPQPNALLIALAVNHAGELETNKNNPEKLKDIIRSKKRWWQP